MLGGFVGGLIVAWILSFFNVNIIVLQVMQPFFNTVILTNSHYYVFFGLIGLISSAFGNNRYYIKGK